ncbi:MAG: efflux RND transporter permease subunit [Melioribacteraceae bacterium]|nr:efflux RND transporter permease subunit [Melioribacteraceae bacterium]MCF8353948.1 efflux RND transporter permease subunit [Melioribacteraceae bacterium]MCF8393676.1 efflux RND transporter permease subunit [Melioribacteraceae bacterium]MCF8419582.1 efflux RND transporter permease subunit [Melioribacteraceae bacterium]
MKITDVSVDNRTSVFILIFILTIVGVASYISLPRESAPDIQIPLVIVSTPYFGVSPEDVESLITQPIEKELNAISEVKKLTSSSFEGYSIIRVEFESGYDIDDALQKVRDKVEKAEAELPDDVEKPEIIEINFSEFPILTFNIAGPQGLVKLKDIADDMKDDIENVNGVLEVKISGGLEREVKVEVDHNKLIHYNIRFDDVISAIADENRTIPGGSIDVNSSSFLVRIPGEFDEPYIIQDLIVKMQDDKPIYISDVADVKYSFQDRNTFARLNGADCVTVNVSKRVGANIIDIANEVKSIIDDYENRLPSNLSFTITVDQSKDIERSVKNLENNIISGLVLVLVVLFSLLGLRNAFFVAIAIPLSMLISFIILSALNITLNFIVLFSLILALGMLVDNAIVIVENIYKFLEEGSGLFEAAKQGAKEVAWPITTSTLTTLMAFSPLLFWPGVVGDFMQYLPLTLIITLASSLFVALVINPVIASKFMKLENKDEKEKTIFGKIFSPIRKMTHYFSDSLLPKTLNKYQKFLEIVLGSKRNPGQKIHWRNWLGLFLVLIFLFVVMSLMQVPAVPNVIVLIGSVLLGFGVIVVFMNPRLRVLATAFLLLIIIILAYREFDHGVEFFPSVDPERVFINVESPTGTNIEMSDKIAKSIEQRLKPFMETDVREFVANVGSSNNPFDGGSSTPNKSTITVQFISYNDRSQPSSQTMDEIRDAVIDIAGAEIEVKKQDMGPPVGPPINIEIIGDDFEQLGDLAKIIKKQISDTPGLVDLKDDYDSGRPEVRVLIDREKAALFSMNTSIIANNIRTAINGYEASKYRINEEEYDITVRLKESQRESVDVLRNMRINYNNKKGTTLSVPLISVAEISYDKGPGAIRRKDMKRVVTITGNVDAEFNQNEVLATVQDRLKDYRLPPDYRIEYTGQNEEQAKASEFLGQAFMIAFLGIFLILVIQFNSLAQPLIIMSAVGISLIGVFIGLIVFAMPFGIIMTGIGVISLAVVVVNNNIVLIDYINILRNRGLSIRDAVIRAGTRRFRPVTLTAITTILGLIPLTFGFGFDIYSFSFESGGVDADFWRSMGVAVIFGLMFGTVLTLVIVPVIYSVISDLPDALKTSFKNLFGK